MRRVEDAPLLRGQGRFVDDLPAEGALVMVVLRSPIAHGNITGIDLSAAREMPGVRLILTAPDLEREQIGPLRCRAALEGLDGPMIEPVHPVLATGKVVFTGQPIAAVVAASLNEALDAAESIDVEIERLDAVTDPRSSAGALPIWPEAPENRAFRWQNGNPDKTDALIASAAHVIRQTVVHPRIAISPIEPRGCLAAFDEETESYTLDAPSQGVVSLRAALSECLGIENSQLRVRTGDVGGSFAAKIWPFPEHALTLVAARLTRRQVRWTGTRSEAFTGDVHGRGRVDEGELALDEDGRFLAFRIRAYADMGAFLNTAAPFIVSTGAVRPFSQQYDIDGQHYLVEAKFTNLPPTDAYRGAGKPESTATLERLIDIAAHQLDMDRLELRQRNLIRPDQLPYSTPMGEHYDGGDFPALAGSIAAAADWPGVKERKAVSTSNGLLRGAAVGFHLHATGGSTVERSFVKAMADGTVLVRSGSQDSGQGHRTALALVTAETLEIDVSRIRVEQGDSKWLEVGGGSGGSNLMPVAANTVHRTAMAMVDAAKPVAADLLEAAAPDITYGKGAFRIVGTDRAVDLAEVAATMDAGNGCTAELDFEGNHTTFPNGSYVCEVEIDPETGHVRIDRFTGIDDLGRVINASAARAQIQGGIGQGIGEALMEGMRFDRDGQPMTASFLDYALPRADQVPMFNLDWQPTPSPNALLDAKGVGELSSIGAPGLLVNAVLDALAPHGITHLDKPLTPLRIWKALNR